MKEEVMERVRKDISPILKALYWRGRRHHGLPIDSIGVNPELEQILSIPVNGKSLKEIIEGYANGKLVELADDQSLPEVDWVNLKYNIDYTNAYLQLQQDMLKDNWFKVIKEIHNGKAG